SGGTGIGDGDAGDGIDARAGSIVRILGGPIGAVWGGSVGGASTSWTSEGGAGVRLDGSSALLQADVPVIGGWSGTIPSYQTPDFVLGPGSDLVTVDAGVPTLT